MAARFVASIEFSLQPGVKNFLLQIKDVGKTRDGRTYVTVKMGKTRDRTVRDIYVTDP